MLATTEDLRAQSRRIFIILAFSWLLSTLNHTTITKLSKARSQTDHKTPSTMTDAKIRCALVYRIDAGLGETPSVTMLAKYDFIADYEAHEGAASEGALYAGRGNYGDAVTMVLKNDPPGAAEVGSIGGFKVVQSDAHQVVYGGDSDGLCKSRSSHFISNDIQYSIPFLNN